MTEVRDEKCESIVCRLALRKDGSPKVGVVKYIQHEEDRGWGYRKHQYLWRSIKKYKSKRYSEVGVNRKLGQ